MTWDWELKGIGSCFGGEGKKKGGAGRGGSCSSYMAAVSFGRFFKFGWG